MCQFFMVSLTSCILKLVKPSSGCVKIQYLVPVHSLANLSSSMKMNNNCRNNSYPGTNGKINRFPVPDEKVSWETNYENYDPVSYTSPGVLGKPWSDPEIGTSGFSPEWNSDKGDINRLSGIHKYEIDKDGYPINPIGRTGLKGRGVLGRWGPNNAGDAIVTRWKLNSTKEKIYDENTKKPVLQFVSIKRKDCGEWAIPGGFNDKNEDLVNTVKREFFEEALNSGSNDFGKGKDEALIKINEIFNSGKLVYSGYVDDRRNTDQAWITTTAMNFHDQSGDIFNDIKLNAGDDAGDVMWLDIDKKISLYANHKDFIQQTTAVLDAHF